MAIKTNTQVVLRFNLKWGNGAPIDLRRHTGARCTLVMPDDTTAAITDIGYDRLANQIWVRIAGTHNSQIGSYKANLAVMTQNLQMVTTGIVKVYDVAADGEDYKLVTLSLTVTSIDTPVNIGQGYSPKIVNGEWVVFDDSQQAYVPTGQSVVATEYVDEAVEAEAEARQQDVQSLESSLSSEVSRAQAKEAELEEAIDDQNGEIEDFKSAITDQVNNYQPVVIEGDVTNAADEEDLTSDNGLLKIKNRSALNGMGYVILRRGASFASQVVLPNTIYEIRYNFAVDNNFVAPENIRFKYAGGSLIVDGVSTHSSLVKASEVGLIPNAESFSEHNAQLLVYYTNLGFKIELDGSFFVSKPSTAITNNVSWKGGELIVIAPSNGSFVFEISAEVSISLNAVHVTGTFNLVNRERRILFKVTSVLYLPYVEIVNCDLEKVQVYTHVGQDVNQTTEKDGVKRMLIRNNHIHDIPSEVIYCPNIKSENILIKDNTINGIRNNAFSFLVDNTYTHAEGSRIARIVFSNNNLDNSDYIISDSTATYNCMCIVEGETCIFTNNQISNLICTGNSNGTLYPFYISCRNVDILNNEITNVVSFVDNLASYDIFKCKGIGSDGSIPANSSRRIVGNKYYLTKDCVAQYGDVTNPPRRTMVGLMQSFENVTISDNLINAYCAFGFGGAYSVYHNYYEFSRNTIVVDRLVDSNLFRITPTQEKGEYVVYGNKVISTNIPENGLSLLWDNGTNKPASISVKFWDNDFGYYNLPLNSGYFDTDKFEGKLSLLHTSTYAYTRYWNGACDIVDFNYVDTTIQYVNCLNVRHLVHSYKDVNHRFYYRFSSVCTDASSKGTMLIAMRSENYEVKAMLVLDDTEVYFVDKFGKKTSRERVTDLARFTISLTDPNGAEIGSFSTLKSRTEIYINQNNKAIQLEVEWFDNRTDISFETENAEVDLTDVYHSNAKDKLLINASTKAMVYFDGQQFLDSDGHTADLKKGNTQSRPANLNSTTDAGYQYFDTTLGKPIYWQGTKWVDATGADLT